MIVRVIKRPRRRPRVHAFDPVEDAALLGLLVFSASARFRNRELSIGVSVKLTSIDTRIENAIVQPKG